VILDLIAEAKADGLPAKRACKVLGLSPRSVQRWKAPVQPLPTLAATPPAVMQSRPYNALTASEAATVIALIRSPKHADASCRDLALALQAGPTPTYVSHVTIWQYERALNCNGPRGRQVSQSRTAPDTDWVNGPNQTVGLGHHLSSYRGAIHLLVPVQPARPLEPQEHRLAHQPPVDQR